MEMPKQEPKPKKSDSAEGALMTNKHLKRIQAEIEPGTEARAYMAAEEAMNQQVEETRAAEGKYIIIPEEAEDTRTERLKSALSVVSEIREKGISPTDEQIRKIAEDLRIAKFIRNDVDIAVYEGDLKRLIKEMAGE